MVETFSSYQLLLQQDPTEAERLSTDIRDKWDINLQPASIHLAAIVDLLIRPPLNSFIINKKKKSAEIRLWTLPQSWALISKAKHCLTKLNCWRLLLLW